MKGEPKPGPCNNHIRSTNKLTPALVVLARKMYWEQGITQRDIILKLNLKCSRSTLSEALNYITWWHLPRIPEKDWHHSRKRYGYRD